MRKLFTLTLALMASFSLWAADSTLVSIDFTSSDWNDKTFSQGNTTTPDVINSVTFYSKNSDNNKQFSLTNHTTKGLTFPNNNMATNNYFFCIPLTNIHDSITVTITHGYSSKKAYYSYAFADGREAFEASCSSITDVNDANSSDTEITFGVKVLQGKGHLFIGRKSSSYTEIKRVVVTTPPPASQYEVTYKANGGIGSDITTEASTVAECTFTAPDGKTFDSWNTLADGTGASYAVGAKVTGELTLFAQWVNLYTVTFDMQSHGDAIDSQNVKAGGKVTKPEDPTTEGYFFDGWFKEAGCTNAWDFDNDVVNAATTLYAKWTAYTTCAELTPSTEATAKLKVDDEVVLDGESKGGKIVVAGMKTSESTIAYNSNGLYFSGNGTDSIRVELTHSLKNGSVIIARLQAAGTGARGLKIRTLTQAEVAILGWSNAAMNDVKSFSYVVKAGDGLAGQSKFCLQRTGNVYLKYVKVGNCGGEVPTALENTESEVSAVKFVENGQLFIRRGEKVYTVTGVEVK